MSNATQELRAEVTEVRDRRKSDAKASERVIELEEYK
jgi:hypothetical protein